MYRCMATKVLSLWIWVAKTEAFMPAELSDSGLDSVLTHTFLHKNPKTFRLKKERSRPKGLLDRAVGPWNAVISPLTRRQYAMKGKVCESTRKRAEIKSSCMIIRLCNNDIIGQSTVRTVPGVLGPRVPGRLCKGPDLLRDVEATVMQAICTQVSGQTIPRHRFFLPLVFPPQTTTE